MIKRANGILLTGRRCRDQRLQRGIGRRQQVMQQAAMRDRRLYRGVVVTGIWQGRQLFQPILDLTRGGRRRIQREVQHGGRERGGGGDDRRRSEAARRALNMPK